MSRGDVNRRRTGSGFAYVAMLFALAVFGIGLAAVGQNWRNVSDRDKEDELLQVGEAYAHAIGQYYEHSPGIPKTYPLQLVDLLEDKRFVGTERYLRQLYRDPVSNSAQWGIVREKGGGIIGVYSLSEKATLRKRVQALGDTMVMGKRYSEWKFVYQGSGNHAP